MSDFCLEDVWKRYGSLDVLADATATFRTGRTHVITGPSGAGKTTVLRLLAGLEAPDAGMVARPPDLRLGMTFQEDRLLDNLTATANIRLPHGRVSGGALEELLASERAALEAVGLPVDDRPVRELSGGQRRRVAILRCALSGAGALLFDEPLKGMDEKTANLVTDFLEPLLAGRTVFWVTHDPDERDALPEPVLWTVRDGGVFML